MMRNSLTYSTFNCNYQCHRLFWNTFWLDCEITKLLHIEKDMHIILALHCCTCCVLNVRYVVQCHLKVHTCCVQRVSRCLVVISYCALNVYRHIHNGCYLFYVSHCTLPNMAAVLTTEILQ